MRVGFISLGCSKNLVDTELFIGLFKENGYEIESRLEEAQIVVINTCGFIKSAQEEAINSIFEVGRQKAEVGRRKVKIFDCYRVFSRGTQRRVTGVIAGSRFVYRNFRLRQCLETDFGIN